MFLVFFFIDVHALDLVKLPKKEQKVTNRKKPKKVPDWHLTGKETMEYIREAHTRQEEKQKKEEKYQKIKIEAVKNTKKMKEMNEKIAESDPLGMHQADQQNTAL